MNRFHPSIIHCLSGVRSQGPRLPSPQLLCPFFRGDPRYSQASVLGLPGGLLPEGRILNTLFGRHQGGILTRCQAIWLLSMWRSRGSTPSSFWKTKLLTLSLRKTPATLMRKLMPAACTCDLVLPVTTQSS